MSLVAALHGTVALAQVDHVAERVAESEIRCAGSRQILST
jgi:hypothetical protein